MKQILEKLIQEGLTALGVERAKFTVEHPTNITFGDYSTNAGIVSKKAQDLLDWLNTNKPEGIESIEIKSGFINFFLSKKFFAESLKNILDKGNSFGKGEHAKGFRVMVEYTDPNLMKAFHIGHLMSNSIGESLSRVIEWNGADVIRANYYSDVGLNIAKAVWGIKSGHFELPKDSATLSEKAEFLGKCYAYGVAQSDSDETIAHEIREINKKIFDRTDTEINNLYDIGKAWSLEYLNSLYTKLGSTFDWVVGESEVAEAGRKLVLDNPDVFVESEGAIVFHAEEYDPKLHTRVFINKEGLPTYEAKELGLTEKKFKTYDLDLSVVITANEQSDYFRVVLEAMKQVLPKAGKATKHLPHGVLKLTTGKMSSRTGDVITAESLIEEVKEKTKGNEQVAVGAIKYMILRANIGGDIVFDVEKSVSTEGDSGVYLQYAHARANSVLEKAKEKDLSPAPLLDLEERGRGEVRIIEKLLYRFPEVVARAGAEYAPHHIVTYLTELAGAFNNFYAHEQVISDDPESAYRLAIVEAFRNVMRNGLTVLGIPAPEKM